MDGSGLRMGLTIDNCSKRSTTLCTAAYQWWCFWIQKKKPSQHNQFATIISVVSLCSTQGWQCQVRRCLLPQCATNHHKPWTECYAEFSCHSDSEIRLKCACYKAPEGVSDDEVFCSAQS